MNCLEKRYQKKPHIIFRKIAKKSIGRICQDFDLSFVVLFGSRATGRKGFKNDYDIAVLTSSARIGETKELELICRFSQLLQTDNLHLVILNFAHPLLQYEVAQEGKLLYEVEEGSFNTFRWRAIQRWNDNRKFSNLNMNCIEDYLSEVKQVD